MNFSISAYSNTLPWPLIILGETMTAMSKPLGTLSQYWRIISLILLLAKLRLAANLLTFLEIIMPTRVCGKSFFENFISKMGQYMALPPFITLAKSLSLVKRFGFGNMRIQIYKSLQIIMNKIPAPYKIICNNLL